MDAFDLNTKTVEATQAVHIMGSDECSSPLQEEHLWRDYGTQQGKNDGKENSWRGRRRDRVVKGCCWEGETSMTTGVLFLR